MHVKSAHRFWEHDKLLKTFVTFNFVNVFQLHNTTEKHCCSNDKRPISENRMVEHTFHWVLWLPWCFVESTYWPHSSTVWPADPNARLCWGSSSHHGLQLHTWDPRVPQCLIETREIHVLVKSTGSMWMRRTYKYITWNINLKFELYISILM